MPRIYVVGIGPGNMEDMTDRAEKAIQDADVIVGYYTYIKLIKDYFPHKEFIESGMTKEVERCELVMKLAGEGKNVALISSGDSGIYGMAGIMLELMNKSKSQIPVEVIPGITAASSAASILGAPIMHDFAVISLSDLMTPLELIYKRLECAAEGDFVICIYNPKSKTRCDYIIKARDIILKYSKESTPVGIVRNAGRENEEYNITDLKNMLDYKIDMFTVIIIGNSSTYIENGKIITPRGYKID
ncbi:precorrin-3B C(17)-methyltransferase [Pseudobacteroides cellulosolvens]|uniref:Precorrin-3B C17-methyltransferase n=1 Tax=Pseudobacteroides cellulosolvens ATCC 35603 = DSM 2933 TaxID=398512 RepID=A0A0L6JRI4_9FIRM|nr:precorrin-3B C(17)-methyltransferase [Pseudobacteroides cellulosolvens]KNY28007.1 precorrin-3B C17-methyltransferase [Pseudobacteroides cellulosolvens ATCC 35603 = DSM 2933]